MTELTPSTLPSAVADLFRVNHYDVVGPVKINGAEIDLVASSLGAPFQPKVFIEVTVEYVDNTKYGKDLTKLAMAREIENAATCLIVSLRGFTADVRERAAKTRIETLTYSELFSRFEKFQPYLEMMTGDTIQGRKLARLEAVYERPSFHDSHGSNDDALDWMDQWLADPDSSKSWLIVTGEYGTGKSALTQMLQRRWLRNYSRNPAQPIPVRVELGTFSKQLDAQGLLHHFLDHNGLSHVPIDFFWTLVRSRRVVLLLDGYDEMAQYMSQRERRQSLKALAELSGGGARGILTSRPNYFTETEEFALFDHLYREISLRSRLSQDQGEEISRREEEVDELIQRSILDRYERSLRDLSPEQSRALVRNTLRDSPAAADTVISVLDRVFRATGENAEVALSGKPVIISYLIEVASSLDIDVGTRLSEWDVYTLIVDKLALRDLEQTARLRVDERRLFLQQLAVLLTRSPFSSIDEDRFRQLVESVFKVQLRRFTGARRASEVDVLFEDLRRSGTLTRSSDEDVTTWKFSHNSLREFLAAEHMIDELLAGRSLRVAPPISDAMRSLVASRSGDQHALIERVTVAWADVGVNPAVGSYLTLIWDTARSAPESSLLEEVAGRPPVADSLHLAGLCISSTEIPRDLRGAKLRECTISEVSFCGANLAGAEFTGSLLEAVNFDDANLENCSFVDSVIIDASISGASLVNSDFTGVDSGISLMVDGKYGRERIEGPRALGLLAFHGAFTDRVNEFYVWSNHPKFSIVEKVVAKLVEGGLRQRRGLEQRGAAAADPRFAKRLIRKFSSLGFVETPLGRPDLVEITPTGRAVLGAFHTDERISDDLVDFLRESR